MILHHTFAQHCACIALEGELGHHEAIDAMSRIGEILEVHVPRELVLDLSGLSFMDSSGIAVVVQTAKRCRQMGSAFAVEGAPKHAMRILSAAGVPNLVTFREKGAHV